MVGRDDPRRPVPRVIEVDAGEVERSDRFHALGFWWQPWKRLPGWSFHICVVTAVKPMLSSIARLFHVHRR
jgi:hypothetical protein